jgi:hypothetical protein
MFNCHLCLIVIYVLFIKKEKSKDMSAVNRSEFLLCQKEFPTKLVSFVNSEEQNVLFNRSLSFLSKLQSGNKKILLVTTDVRLGALVRAAGERLNQEYFIGKWIGGKLTNQRTRPDCVVVVSNSEPLSSDILTRETSLCSIPVVVFSSKSLSWIHKNFNMLLTEY